MLQIPKELKERLQKFSSDSACPKCGSDVVSSRYQRYHTVINGIDVFDFELVKRICSRCGYIWDELPCVDNKVTDRK